MTPKFKAIIVDDEKLARLDLKYVLSTFEEVEIVGEANDISSAEQLIVKLHPNLVFLDIQLRGESGFDLLEKIYFSRKDISPELDFVFVTAYDKYAIKAFESNALDYLLKPVSTERLQKTIDKLIEKEPESANQYRKLSYDDVILISNNHRTKFLKIDSITAITSNADYSFIYTIDKAKFITRKTMKEWEIRLPDNHFCRIHRSTIINIGYILKMSDSLTDSLKVYLHGFEKPFNISKRYSAKIKKKFV